MHRFEDNIKMNIELNKILNTFYYQLTHTTLKNVESLKHSKIHKNAPNMFRSTWKPSSGS